MERKLEMGKVYPLNNGNTIRLKGKRFDSCTADEFLPGSDVPEESWGYTHEGLWLSEETNPSYERHVNWEAYEENLKKAPGEASHEPRASIELPFSPEDVRNGTPPPADKAKFICEVAAHALEGFCYRSGMIDPKGAAHSAVQAAEALWNQLEERGYVRAHA